MAEINAIFIHNSHLHFNSACDIILIGVNMKNRPPHIQAAVFSGHESLLSYHGRNGGKNSRKNKTGKKQEATSAPTERPVQLNMMEVRLIYPD